MRINKMRGVGLRACATGADTVESGEQDKWADARLHLNQRVAARLQHLDNRLRDGREHAAADGRRHHTRLGRRHRGVQVRRHLLGEGAPLVGKLLLLRRPHLLPLHAAEAEWLACTLPHPKRRQHWRLWLVGHGAALPLHEPHVGGVGLGPLALRALACVDDDRARAHAR